MGSGQELLDLVDWRRRVGDLYRLRGPGALDEFRRGRDHLFRTHPQSPIEDRAAFTGLDYFPSDPEYRVSATFEPEAEPSELVIDTGGDDGAIRYRRAGRLRFNLAGTECSLLLLSLVAYGGGRYLFDTVKNTDGLVLEIEAGSPQVLLDFNYAYNPSCAYSPRWACPLAPAENALPIPIRAGEKTFQH